MYKLNSIVFNDSEDNPTTIEDVKNVTVFIGPNNVGKTTTLKEIFNYVTGSKTSHIITRDFKEERSDDFKELVESYDIKYTIDQSSSYGKYSMINPNLAKLWQSGLMSNPTLTEKNFKQYIGNGFVVFLNTENRLQLISRQNDIHGDRLHRGAETVFELFDGNEDKFKQVKRYFERLFTEDVVLFRGNNGSLYFKINKDGKNHNFSSMTKDQLLDYDDSNPNVDEQGDGMKSALAILCGILGTDRPIILLDEPEAFLHPPQAFEIGRIIGEISRKCPDKQIFISTHSSDFLKGLLSKPRDKKIKNRINLDVVYLKRDGNNPIVNLVSNDFLQGIINDPFLSSINLLEGFFYNGTIVVEGQSDRIFYNNAFDVLYPDNQLFYLEVGGKASFDDVAQRYHEAKVPFVIASDFDIIFNASNGDFKKLASALFGVDISSKQNNVDAETQEKINTLVNSAADIITNVYNTKKTISLKSLKKSLEDIKTLLSNVNSNEIISNKDVIMTDVSELKTLMEPIEATYTNLRDSGINAVSSSEDKKKVKDLLSSCHEIGLYPIPVGTLESWFPVFENGTKISDKNIWIKSALKELPKQLENNTILSSYIKEIGNYLKLIEEQTKEEEE